MWIPPLPRRFVWDHNEHYHRWLLRQLPERVGSAIDIGCGDGALARLLSERVDRVDAIDVSAEMIDRARAISSTNNVRWLVGDVLADELPADGYDVVTAVSSLHHMPLREGLARLAGLVRPGGVLVVVGLYRQATFADHAMEVLTLPPRSGWPWPRRARRANRTAPACRSGTRRSPWRRSARPPRVCPAPRCDDGCSGGIP